MRVCSENDCPVSADWARLKVTLFSLLVQYPACCGSASCFVRAMADRARLHELLNGCANESVSQYRR